MEPPHRLGVNLHVGVALIEHLKPFVDEAQHAAAALGGLHGGEYVEADAIPMRCEAMLVDNSTHPVVDLSGQRDVAGREVLAD